jgi:Tol biopolymer transport system component
VPSAKGRDGHLLYVNRGTLFAVPFDPEALAVRGTPSPILEQVSYSSVTGFAQFDFSQQGTLMYRSGDAEGSRLTVQWLDSDGKMQPLLAKPDAYQSAWLSPDGQRLAISTTDLWIYEWRRDTMTRLTFGGSLGVNSTPAVWSPDGRYIIFRKPGEGLFWTRSDGAGQPQVLVQSKANVMAYSFTFDGKRLAFREVATGTGQDLWTVPVESDGAGLRGGKPEMFLGTQFNERDPAFSPDGRWLAYTSDEAGTPQIFVRAFPDRGGKWQISDSGGGYPEWSRNGRELFFRNADNQIAVSAYTVKGDSFVADKPRVWSEKHLATAVGGGMNYNVAPDSKRAVVFMPVEATPQQQNQSHVIFLENFFDELRRKVPLGK